MNVDRTERWLRLLRRVTESFPRWSVWKNVASALEGHGDVDSFAPPGDWSAIQDVWLTWLRDEGIDTAILCRHVPQGPHFIALEQGSPWLWQFDVKERGTLRGATLIDVDDLAGLAEIDDRGFRRIRPGSEGVLKLLYNGMHPGGKPDYEGIAEKDVVALLEADPEGVRLAAERLCGPARGPMLDAVEALLRGEWDRTALLAVEAWFRIKALSEPRVAVSRTWFNLVLKRNCPILQVIRHRDRRIPGDRAAWLAEVAEDHVIVDPADVVP